MKHIFNTSLINIRHLGRIHKFRCLSTDVIKSLEMAYDKLNGSASQSMLRRNLDEVIFERLKVLETPAFKSNLMHCAQSGFREYDSRVGIYAPDAESYKVFADLFDPIIYDIHGFKKEDRQPTQQFGNVAIFEDLDPYHSFVLSTRIRVARNIEGHPFTPRMTEAKYKEVEKQIRLTLTNLDEPFSGIYYPLRDMSNAFYLGLKEDHMFKDPDRFLQSGDIWRYAPTGRGIHYSQDKTFSVWVNFEDHLRIISMQQGANFAEVYSRMIEALEALGAHLRFCCDDRLGYLTCSPINLGTTMRASVLIKLVKLPKNVKVFQEVLDKFHLQVRGTYGKFTTVEKGVYDISNRRCLGITDYDAIRYLYDGVKEIIRLEKCIKVPLCC